MSEISSRSGGYRRRRRADDPRQTKDWDPDGTFVRCVEASRDYVKGMRDDPIARYAAPTDVDHHVVRRRSARW
jgi:hypothetical protein